MSSLRQVIGDTLSRNENVRRNGKCEQGFRKPQMRETTISSDRSLTVFFSAAEHLIGEAQRQSGHPLEVLRLVAIFLVPMPLTPA